jgi:dolichyl-diphosphooligosaccharide--protein glycosyltransferase
MEPKSFVSLPTERLLFGTFPVAEVPPLPAPVKAAGLAALGALALYQAWDLRIIAVEAYGMLIHEFDPWFNFRAAEYMSAHGWSAFTKWFDHESWYPVGRPVGTTTYPGLQLLAVGAERVLAALGSPAPLTNICVMLPVWGAMAGIIALAALTATVTGSFGAAAISAFLYGAAPAHLMRSVGGGFDNESAALPFMLGALACWVAAVAAVPSAGAALRRNVLAAAAGVLYAAMAATWGGHVFALNLVAAHAALQFACDFRAGRSSLGLSSAYGIFYGVGMGLASQVPVIGTAPFRSLEMAPALATLFGFAIVAYTERRVTSAASVAAGSAPNPVGGFAHVMALSLNMGLSLLVAAVLLGVAAPAGFFIPLGVRVRAMFASSGNPLVDSVQEHAAGSIEGFWHFFDFPLLMWLPGWLMLVIRRRELAHGAATFVTVYSMVAIFFGTRMMRLFVLGAPIVSLCAAAVYGASLPWALAQLWWSQEDEADATEARAALHDRDDAGRAERRGGRRRPSAVPEALVRVRRPSPFADGIGAYFSHEFALVYRAELKLRAFVGIIVLASAFIGYGSFTEASMRTAITASSPQVVWRVQRYPGAKPVLVDDFLRTYAWLRENTTADARVLAWWDYGYQIAGIANRTTLADGNTWNQEHIAAVGMMLLAEPPKAHALIRHVADYVLVYSGSHRVLDGDLAKAGHMARIAHSVHRDFCPTNDPTCNAYDFEDGDLKRPTKRMRGSLLYSLGLHGNSQFPNVTAPPELFTEVFRSQRGMLRVFKVENVSEESRQWLADPANRKCDAPGSWYCVGQYPPAPEWQQLVTSRNDPSDAEFTAAYLEQKVRDEHAAKMKFN